MQFIKSNSCLHLIRHYTPRKYAIELRYISQALNSQSHYAVDTIGSCIKRAMKLPGGKNSKSMHCPSRGDYGRKRIPVKGGRSQRPLARLKPWPTANDLGTKRQEEYRTYEFHRHA